MADQTQQKFCKVCGMPLQKPEDYPNANTNLEWCKYCGTEESIHHYDQLVKGMSKFMQESQGMNEDEADKAAKATIDNSPAVKEGLVKKAE